MGNIGCVATIFNSCSEHGTTAFERVFMAQEASNKDGIFVILELLPGQPDYTLAEVEVNVAKAVREHSRLRECLSDHGLWEEVHVDLKNHLRWVDEVASAQASNGREESREMLHALASMPAFESELEEIPRWQVLVSRRKLIFHAHHAALDGVGIALVAGTLLNGQSAAEAEQFLRSAPSKTRETHGSGGFLSGATVALQTALAFNRHSCMPFQGAWCSPVETAVTDHRSFAKVENIRYIHLGPYPLQSLKQAAKASGVTLNSKLLSAITIAIARYCRQHGDRDLKNLGVAIPVSFKTLDRGIKANNDFATMVVSIPAGSEDGEPLEMDPSLWSVSNAFGASGAQASLSLLPRPAVAWMVDNGSKLCHFIFSNVNAAEFSNEFFCERSRFPRKIRAYAYGNLSGYTRLFVLVNSHGEDLHVGLTVDETVVTDRSALAADFHAEITRACEV
eukprot:TRINITY_DN91106_c0_g1_i1.p1 TRINITY_DN91106_c0_g1~~TRINITY_DN91106_c0_g1_i1.p1  ORF type:complete len:468 (+),score=72.77 TRINITY_DN91106_c0_g1_i1:57-1406(+)